MRLKHVPCPEPLLTPTTQCTCQCVINPFLISVSNEHYEIKVVCLYTKTFMDVIISNDLFIIKIRVFRGQDSALLPTLFLLSPLDVSEQVQVFHPRENLSLLAITYHTFQPSTLFDVIQRYQAHPSITK